MAGRIRGVPWHNLVNVYETGEQVHKFAATGAWDAGADTRGVLSFLGDCWVEFRAPGLVQAILGFSGSSGVSAGISDLQWGLYANLDRFQVVESGGTVYDGGASSHTPGQVLRVERQGGTVFYKRNGATQYSHALTAAQAAAAWHVDLSINRQHDALIGWRAWTADPEPAWITTAKRPGVRLNNLLTIAFPSGTRRWTTIDHPVSIPGEGTYEPVVTNWGAIDYESGDHTHALQLVAWTIEVLDVGRDLTRILGSGERWHNAVVTYQLGGPDLPASIRPTRFVGRLLDKPECSGPLRYRLTFKSNDLPLRSPILRQGLTRQDYSSITQEATNLQPAIVYGRHHSEGLVGAPAGLVNAAKIEPWNGSSAVFGSWLGIVSLQMVYKAGVPQSAGGWTWTAPVVNGRRLSQFSVAADPGDAEWAIDVNGLTNSADGTGRTIEQAVDVLKHALTNFILAPAPWRTGGWLAPDPALIDLPSLADAKLILGNRTAAAHIAGQMTGVEFLNWWGETFGIAPCITPEGKVGLIVRMPADAGDLYDAPTIVQTDAGDIEPTWPTEGQAKRIVANFLFSAKDGRALGTHEVYDPCVPHESAAELNLRYSPSLALTPPPTLSGLKAWWDAAQQRQLYNDGDAVHTLNNFNSLVGPNLSQGTAANRPTFRYDLKDRRAWISHDGVNDQLDTGLPLSTFKNAASITCLVALRIRSFAADAHIIGDLGSFWRLRTFTDLNIYANNNDGANDQVATGALRTDLWYVICCRHVGGKLHLAVNDARLLQMPSVNSGNTTTLTNNLSIGGVGTAYLAFDWSEIIIFADDKGEQTRRLMDWMLARHVYRQASSVDVAKDTGSRHLHYRARPPMQWRVNVPPEHWHKERGQILKVQHQAGPSYLPGWGHESWSARPGRILATSWDPATMQQRAVLEDAKLTSGGWWDTGEATLIDARLGDWIRREGRARLGNVLFSRPTYAWVEVPGSSPMAFELISPDTERGEARGLLIQRATANYLKRVSNLNGLAGLSPGIVVGNGTNGSDVQDGTDVCISNVFGEVFGRNYRFVAGGPHATDLYVQLPDTTTITAGEALWLNLILLNQVSALAADEIVWRLVRLASAQYWDDVGATWQAVALWNSSGLMPVGQVSRFWSKKMPHSSDSAFRLQVGLKSGGTASRVGNLFYACLDKNVCATQGVIPNDSGANTQITTTGIDEYRFDCPDGEGFSLVRGSLVMRVVAGFNFADSDQAPYFWHLGGGGAAFNARYASGAWRFVYGGAEVVVSTAPTLSRYDYADLALRWTSSLAEYGEASRATALVRVNGGAWQSASVAITPAADGAAQALFLGGTGPQRTSLWFSRMRAWPIPLAADELKAWFG